MVKNTCNSSVETIFVHEQTYKGKDIISLIHKSRLQLIQEIFQNILIQP
jgi:hypothetical protein